MQYTGSPVAFKLFGLEVYWYAILIVTGMILAVNLSSKELERRNMDGDLIYDLAFYLLPFSIIGARLYYVVFEWDQFRGDFLKMINPRTGGLAIHGGIIFGVIAGLIFVKRRKVDFFKLSDVIMPFLSLAQAIGRWGNFINNEAYGGPTDLPWALIIDGQKVHPTFLYESIGDFLIFIFLLYYLRNKQKKDGQTTMLYLILYGILRFGVEGLRTDSLMIGGLRQAQLISLLGIIIGIIGLTIMSKKKEN